MKNMIIAASIASLFCCNLDAMQRAAVFTCATNPPLQIVKTSDCRLQIGYMSSKTWSLSGKTFNRVPMLQPLNISGDMANQTIISALSASFGKPVTVR